MDRRQFIKGMPAALLLAQRPSLLQAQSRHKGVFLLNRIGPSASQIYIAGADGSDERKLVDSGTLDYNASFSHDGEWIIFTSERDGLGNANIYRARSDGGNAQRLVDSPAVDDAAVFSPDGTRVAFVSTREGHRTNIWTLDIKSGRLRNLTARHATPVAADRPSGFFRPAWSPDGQWLAFSSDRNTQWRGHANGAGWEHTQELSIYMIRADGGGFRPVASRPGYCLGSPKWSQDGRRIVFYECTVEHTWYAIRPELVTQAVSQIVSVDVATGARIEHTSGGGLKVAPQYLSPEELGYRLKGGADQGLRYTSGKPSVRTNLRSPVWSSDGRTVIYEKFTWSPRPQNLPLYSWDRDYEYRYTDVWPVFSRDGKMAITEKGQNSSIAIMDPDGSNRKRIFDVATTDLDPALVAKGLAGAFAPAWSPDGEWIAFGLGHWFQERARGTSKLMRIRRDGTGLETLTDGTVNSGFPSYSADGRQIVFRVWGAGITGLRILNLDDRSERVLTTALDNLPGWSPDGSRIVFTRKGGSGTIWGNFDIYTIRPDGTDLRRLTNSLASDGHAVWTRGGRQILWNSAMYGFRDEGALYDNTFQPYGQVFIMNADGSHKRMITDSPWEDSTPQYVPAG